MFATNLENSQENITNYLLRLSLMWGNNCLDEVWGDNCLDEITQKNGLSLI